MKSFQLNQNEPGSAGTKSRFELEALIETSLPASPTGILRISKLLRDINTPAQKIVEALCDEPLLSTRILRLANSVTYGLEKKTFSIQAAISAVGSKTLHEIVMMGLASLAFAKAISNSVTARKIWEHSLAVAIISRELSETLKLPGTEDSFTCGLLHDIGELLLLSYDFHVFSVLFGKTDENRMLAFEQQHYGYDHAEIGAMIARHWKLPEEICTSIHFHHKPALSTLPLPATQIVEIADFLADINGFGLRCEGKAKLLQAESVSSLHLKEEDLDGIWIKAEQSINETIRAFA